MELLVSIALYESLDFLEKIVERIAFLEVFVESFDPVEMVWNGLLTMKLQLRSRRRQSRIVRLLHLGRFESNTRPHDRKGHLHDDKHT